MNDKNFTTFEEQVQILKDRNLKFNSEETALNALKRYGYYNIINGYKDPYVELYDSEERYKDGPTFEQIYSMYSLDRHIRDELMSAMLEVEDTLRTAVAHTIAESFTANQTCYLNHSNYKLGKKRESGYQLDDILKKFNKIAKDEVQPMKHYRETYGNVPPWILLKGASFGNLVNFVKLLKGEQKNRVISLMYDFPVSLVASIPDIRDLFMDTLFVCLDYRNRAAHGGRIYNFQTKSNFRFNTILHTHGMRIDESDYRKGIGATGLPSLTSALGFMENSAPYNKLVASMQHFVEQHLSNYPGDKDYLNKYLLFSLPE